MHYIDKLPHHFLLGSSVFLNHMIAYCMRIVVVGSTKMWFQTLFPFVFGPLSRKLEVVGELSVKFELTLWLGRLILAERSRLSLYSNGSLFTWLNSLSGSLY